MPIIDAMIVVVGDDTPPTTLVIVTGTRTCERLFIRYQQ